MGENDRVRRREVLKTTGGVVGGLALAGAAATPAAAQTRYYRYDRVRVRLVDVDATPPRFLTVESPLYLTQARLDACDADHPCSLDVLDYRRPDDGDDNDDDDDNDDRGCPGYAFVVLLCHATTGSDAVVLTGFIRDVLSQQASLGADYVVSVSPTTATNVGDPRPTSDPCPGDDRGDDDAGEDDTDDGDDTDDDDGDDDQDDDDGADG